MNELITIKGTKGYLDENGTAHLNLEDVARGLGFTENKNGVEYVKWRRVREYLAEYGFATRGENAFIPENIFYKLCFKASNATARAFQDVVTDEILPTIRKTGGYVANDELFISTYMPFADESTKQLFRLTIVAQKEANRQIAKLQNENEALEIALDVSLKFCTVKRYNIMHNMGWNRGEASVIGKRMTKFCNDRHIEIRPVPDPLYGWVNGYPLTAWKGFLSEVTA